MKNNKTLYYLTSLIILVTLIITITGVFYTTGGSSYDFINQYGDPVKMFGDGIYAHDSHFMAPIFKGTDLTMLLVVVPLTILALMYDRKPTNKSRLFLTSILAFYAYYATSIAFGVTYNSLHLLYIALFALSFFSLIIAIQSVDTSALTRNVNKKFKYKGIYGFLILSGIALTIAWLPDIISSLLKGESLALIEVYTTQVTYVIDMGLISPLAFIALYLLTKRNGMGYVILTILLTICALVGIMLPIQTIYQLNVGIEIPLPVAITKILSFCVLAFFAIFYNIRLYKGIKTDTL